MSIWTKSFVCPCRGHDGAVVCDVCLESQEFFDKLPPYGQFEADIEIAAERMGWETRSVGSYKDGTFEIIHVCPDCIRKEALRQKVMKSHQESLSV